MCLGELALWGSDCDFFFGDMGDALLGGECSGFVYHLSAGGIHNSVVVNFMCSILHFLDYVSFSRCADF